MLEKTLAILSGIKPGTYVPDDVACYDPEELEVLGRLLQRLVYGPSSIRRFLQQKYRVTITRGDFYSEIPSIEELERSFAKPSLLDLTAIFPENAVMIAELARLQKVSHEFDPPLKSSRPGEYAWESDAFPYSDAMAYYAMIRTRRPRTIVEVGSGWQTRVAQMACERNGMGRIVCVEPSPNKFLEALQGVEVVKSCIQDLETGYFNGLLRDGDMLFIDSSLTVKHDGDCLHLYLRILPALVAAITVQVHEVCLPDTLSLPQMRDNQIFGNEQCLFYSYMYLNPKARTVYGNRYHQRNNFGLLEQFMHDRFRAGGPVFGLSRKVCDG